MLRLAYLTVTNAFAALRLLPMSNRDKDAEILALRHQITVLEWQLGANRSGFALHAVVMDPSPGAQVSGTGGHERLRRAGRRHDCPWGPYRGRRERTMGWVDGVTARGVREDGSAQKVRFRLTLFQRVQVPLIIYGVGMAVTSVLAISDEIWREMLFHVMWKEALSALVLGVLFDGNRGVTLTPEVVTVHKLRRRTIRWSDLAGITMDGVLGNRRVVLVLMGGERIKLGAPTGGFPWDPSFEGKFHTIGQWWLGWHRAAGTISSNGADGLIRPAIPGG
jgi:hypothetical protein